MTRAFLLTLLTCLGLHDSVFEVNNGFTGFKVFRALPKDKDEASYLEAMRIQGGHYDFWTEVRVGGAVDIMAPPQMGQQLQQDLAAKGISHSVHIDNIQLLIDQEMVSTSPEERELTKNASGHEMTWTEYHSLDEMYTYLDYLEMTYDFVTTEEIGRSGEGRAMRVLKACRGKCGNKPAVWIDAGVHAREWIAPAAATWIIKELVEQDAAHPDLLDNLDWYILPTINPDGYAFSREHDRMWRKTRSDNGGILGCKGVDLDTNWGFHFNEGGSSNNTCSNIFHGPEAFSEIEIVNVRDFLLARKDQLVFYNSLRSYGQLVLLPWSFQQEPPQDYDQMYALAKKGSDAVGYKMLKGCELYCSSGGSVDWAHGEAGIGFTSSMDLRDTGMHGFLLPPEQIIPTGEETWLFHVTVLRELMATKTL